MKLNFLLTILASVFFAPCVAAQETQDDETEETRSWSNLAASGRYAEAMTSETVPDGIPEEYVDSYLADGHKQLLNFTGRYVEAQRLAQGLRSTQSDEIYPTGTAANGSSYSPHPAVEAIRHLAEGRQIVILNEAHQSGRNRAFALELVTALRQDGFTLVGMEALSPNSAAALREHGYSSLDSGFYFSDPLFAAFLQGVNDMGYQWFNYEIGRDQQLDCSSQACSWPDRIAHRERIQAQNIAAVMADNPGARVFLYVGLSHLDETPGFDDEGRPLGWMAAELARLTGIDPLTVDQVTGWRMRDRDLVGPLAEVLASHQINEPTVFVDDNLVPLAPPENLWMADMMVFFPDEDVFGGRPSWLFEIAGRVAVPISLSVEVGQRPLIVQAFRETQAERAIPFDQLAILEDENPQDFSLSLEPGNYQLVGQLAGQDDLDFGFIEVELHQEMSSQEPQNQ